MIMRKKVTYNQKSDEGVLFDKREFYPGDLPTKPGVYIFRDRFSKIIYVGKAANLRKRISSYFQPSRQKTADPKLRSLINSIYTYEFYPVNSESESLILESQLIKEYAPRYNVLLRDDKRFLLIKINLNDQYPTLMLARVRKNDGSTYFGPFPKGGALRTTIDFLIRKFGLRVCRSEIPTEKDRKHCLARIVKDCCEPCGDKISKDDYLKQVEALMEVLNGKVKDLVCEVRTAMEVYVEKRQYEKAAEFRDMSHNIEEIFGKRDRSFRFAKVSGSKNHKEALKHLQEVLDLPKPPKWIECFDNSNIGGTLAVAGMVCFKNGQPDRAKYRRFKIRGSGSDEVPKGGDDFAMMQEVVARRYKRLLDEESELPDLIVIDGGKGQLSAAVKGLKEINSPFIPIIGLAKRYEEIFALGRKAPIILDKRSPGLKLLQTIRDETHRFAIAYHRKLRHSRIEESLLDDIPGIGDKRKKQLLKFFGSLGKLKKATPEEIIKKVPGIGLKFAEKISSYLKQ